MISIWYTNATTVQKALFDRLMQTVPEAVRQDIQTLRFFKHQRLKLLGRLLVERFHEAQSLPFDWSNWRTDTNGKPYLIDGSPFNITHAGNLVAVAFASEDVGLDLELLKERNIDSIADYLHVHEKKHIARSHNKIEAFYHIWTRKEAFIKAKGTGLLNALHKDNCLSDVLYHANKSWFLYSLSPLVNYRFAVCSTIKNSPIQIDEIAPMQFLRTKVAAA